MRPEPSAGVLGLTMLVAHGCLVYSFGAVLADMAADLGLHEASLAVALTLSAVACAALTPLTGRASARVGAGRLMVAGSVTGVAGVLAAATARDLAGVVVAWVVIGAATSLTLYDVAFAYVVRASARSGASPDRQLLTVTVGGGFASTVFVPLLGVVSGQAGWRAALLVAAGTVAAVNVPLQVWLHRQEGPPVRPHRRRARRRSLRGTPGFLRTRAGVVVVVALGCQGLVAGAVAAYLVAGLLAGGLPRAVAYAAAGAFGAAAVVGRLLAGRHEDRDRLPTLMVRSYGVQVLALLLLAWGARHPAVVVAAGAALGAAGGLSSLARPRLVLSHAGAGAFGAASSALGSVSILAKALGPALAGVVLTAGGYPAMWVALAGVATCSTLVRWLPRPPDERPAPAGGA